MLINNSSKKNILFLFGGQSAEHEISIISAKNILSNLDEDQFNAILIGIDKENGTWKHIQNKNQLNNLTRIILKKNSDAYLNKDCNDTYIHLLDEKIKIDLVFPILHGTNGEDGSIQGLCQFYNIPFVGCGVTTSSICMDKHFTKVILSNIGIPIVPYMKLSHNDAIKYQDIVKVLGAPFFIKPANSGSSIGVHKVENEEEFGWMLIDAKKYDSKILLEKYIAGKDVECAIMGNNDYQVSGIGEIIIKDGWYDYNSKYLNKSLAEVNSKANIADTLTRKIQEYTKDIFKELGGTGLSRVDFIVSYDDEIFFNEVNTMPGFTNLSLFPNLFMQLDITYSNLITNIINLGLNKNNTDKID